MMWGIAQGQSVGYWRYDTIVLQKIGGNSELKILNATRGVTGGVLTNMGNGRTAFVVPSAGGSTNTSIGTGFRIGVNSTNNIKSLSAKYGITLDSATAGEVGIRADTATLFPAVRATIPGGSSGFSFNDSLKWVSVISYGADPTGAVSSTTAFNAAIATGLTVYVPPGRYLIHTNTTQLATKQTIIGEYGQSVLFTDTTTCNIITTGDSSTVANLTLYGTGQGTIPGGTLTLQNGIVIAEDAATIINCSAKSFDGSGFYLLPTSGSKYYNKFYGCYAEDCTVGFFDILNSEYAIFDGCHAQSCVVAFWDRSAGNNRYVNCTGNNSTDGFRLTAGGNGDHGSVVGCTFNHNTNNINVQSCTNGQLFIGNQLWSGNILIGSTGTANKVIFRNNFISNGTITPTTTTTCIISDNAFGTSVVETAVAGTYYFNNTGSTTNAFFETVTDGVTTPTLTGGTAAGSGITYKSTTGTGTTTGMAHRWVGGTNGNLTLAQINNDGMMSIGSAGFAPMTNVRLRLAGANSSAANYTLYATNSNGDVILYGENNANVNMGAVTTMGNNNTALTNTIKYPGVFQHITSGTASAGFGVGVQFNAESGSGTVRTQGSFTFPYTDVTNAAEYADFTVNAIRGGSLVERLRAKDAALTYTKGASITMGIGANLKTVFASVGNVGTGEDDLQTFTVPAGTLSIDGDYIDFTMSFSVAANSTLKVFFGATQLFTFAALATDAVYRVTGQVVRTGATTQRATFEMKGGSGTIVTGYQTPAETLSGTVVLKATGEGTSNNDIIQTLMTVKYFPFN